MPPTPLHFTAFLWLHFRTRGKIDPIALALSTTLPDLEPALKIWLDLPNKHGFFHSFLGAGLAGLGIGVIVLLIERKTPGLVGGIHRFFHLSSNPPPYRFFTPIITSILGSLSHVLLDSFTHRTFRFIFYPSFVSSNPFWLGLTSAIFVEAVVVLLSIVSVYSWVKPALVKQ